MMQVSDDSPRDQDRYIGIDGIRMRPAQYVGPLDAPALGTALLHEALCPALDDAVSGCCSRIEIAVAADGSASVRDNGPGLQIHPSKSDPTVDDLFTQLYACREHKKNRHVGFVACGVGLAAMNALSEWCRVEIESEGRLWKISFERGRPVAPLVEAGPAAATGNTIIMKPDATILPDVSFDVVKLSTWFRNTGLNLAGVEVALIDRRGADDCVQVLNP